MQVYTESTDGTYIESKESALVWHYSDADPDFGAWQVSFRGQELGPGAAGCRPDIRAQGLAVVPALAGREQLCRLGLGQGHSCQGPLQQI